MGHTGPPQHRFQSALTSLKQQITLAVRSTMGKQDAQSTSLKKSAHEILVATSTLETTVASSVTSAMEQLEKVPPPTKQKKDLRISFAGLWTMLRPLGRDSLKSLREFYIPRAGRCLRASKAFSGV